MLWYAHILSVIIVFGRTLASSGDASEEFKNCIDQCTADRCEPSHQVALSRALQLTHWTCTDDCKYICMHEITTRDIGRGVPVQQYYGKWPFWRLAGIQEPASVAFSLLNLYSHVQGMRKALRRIADGHPLKWHYLLWSCAGINAWVWSSVFHTRDLPITEKLDYFSAALAILCALHYTVIRLFHLYPRSKYTQLTQSSSSYQGKPLAYKTWSFLSVIIYLAHISYLTILPRFDYAYNMAFNLVLGLSHNALWLIYSSPTSLIRRFPSQPKSYRPQFVTKAAIFVALTTAATTLELFDFPPWERIIDAHSLWHLSTAPITLLWYDFLIEDALDPSWRGQRI